MDIPTATIPPRSSLIRLWPWLVLLLVLLFFSFIRFRLLDMPLERDEGEYAYSGQLILQGIPPYELAYNMKLPGTYFAYALGMAIFGQTMVGVHLTLLLVNSLTIVFVFLLGRKLSSDLAGLAAAASYAFLSLTVAVLGMAAHATQFVVLFAVPAMWLLWQALVNNDRRTYFFSGLLCGLAFMMKQPGLFFGLFGIAAIVLQFAGKRSVFTRDFLWVISVFNIGIVLPFALFCLLMVTTGDFGRFWFWTFDYAKSYADVCSWSAGMTHLTDYIRNNFSVYAGFCFLAAVGWVLLALNRNKRRELFFLTGLTIFSFLGTTPGLYFREHYFVVLLPALALLAGSVLEAPQLTRAKWIPVVLFVVLITWQSYRWRWYFFEAPAAQVAAKIYSENPFQEALTVAQYIRENSKPDDRVAVVGSEPEIYFYAQRHSATGYIYTYPLMEPQPYAGRMQHEMISEIEAAKPAFIVLVMYPFSWMRKADSSHDIFNWTGNYTQKFYEADRVIGLQPDGEIVWGSAEAAAKFHGQMGDFMIIYRRKPDVN
jgi:4-amino-4-deoxy-L-arabinose transferase-like glycosyltransferase